MLAHMAETSQTTEPLSDAAIVARCQRGDGAAWEILVQRYQRLVYAIVRRIGHDEHAAADVFQTVFMRLMTHLPRLTDHDRLQAWIVTTTKREALLQRKRAMRTVSLTHDDDSDGDTEQWDVADDALLPEEALEAAQSQNIVRNGLESLDTRCRELLTLLYRYDDDKIAYEDVARRMDMPLGSIGPTRARCLGKLRKIVEAAEAA